MKKVLVGFLSLILIGQVSFAQPVSDMAVIPMGITIQNIMRLTITKGGNIEFVFKSASDRTNGISGAEYTTEGSVVATQAWDLEIVADDANFTDESGTNTLALGTVIMETVTCSDATATVAAANTALPAVAADVVTLGAVTDGATFTIQWACGTAAATPIPATTAAGRYTVNAILSLVAN